jgi:hypothetical protein
LPSEVEGLASRPEADNLVGIYAALAGVTREAVLAQFGGGNFSAFKIRAGRSFGRQTRSDRRGNEEAAR